MKIKLDYFISTKLCHPFCPIVSLHLCFPGDAMPQNGTVFEGRRRAGRCHTSKASGQAPAAALIQRVTLPNGDPAATARTPNGASPRRVVNGYINHGHKEKSKKSPPTRGMDSPVHDASAAGDVGTAAVSPGATSENGTTCLDAVASPCHSDQAPPKAFLSAPAKKQRRRQKRCTASFTAALRRLFRPWYTFTFIHVFRPVALISLTHLHWELD